MRFDTCKLADIKEFLIDLPADQWQKVSERLISDDRATVRKLGESLQTRIRKLESEHERLAAMCRFEMELTQEANLLCGVDEAGRGPLAGPVVAAAVILPEGFMPIGLDDSKKVPESRRESLYYQITENAVAWGVGIIGPERIDEINILEATREAMMMAVMKMKIKPDFVLIDAVEIKSLMIPHKGIIKGDEKCLSIAAASIIAKVTRDRLMMELGKDFPEYGFQVHKGYGTAMHYEALRLQGITKHHRKSFLTSFKEIR